MYYDVRAKPTNGTPFRPLFAMAYYADLRVEGLHPLSDPVLLSIREWR